jgi:Ala-tRNA(Pro) deacylase
MLHLESGSLSPLGLWFDEEQRIRLAFDKDVQREGRIAFHPCDNTATVLFEQRVFWEEVVPALGHEAISI